MCTRSIVAELKYCAKWDVDDGQTVEFESSARRWFKATAECHRTCLVMCRQFRNKAKKGSHLCVLLSGLCCTHLENSKELSIPGRQLQERKQKDNKAASYYQMEQGRVGGAEKEAKEGEETCS